MRDPGDPGPQTTIQQSMQSSMAGNNTLENSLGVKLFYHFSSFRLFLKDTYALMRF